MLPNFYYKSFSLLKYSLLFALFFINNEAYSQVVNDSGSSNKKQTTVENLIQTFSTNEAVKIFCYPDSVLKLSLSQPIDSIITLEKFKEILKVSELVCVNIQPRPYMLFFLKKKSKKF